MACFNAGFIERGQLSNFGVFFAMLIFWLCSLEKIPLKAKHIRPRELTYPPTNGILKMIFLFHWWDMLIPWRVVDNAPLFDVLVRCYFFSRQRFILLDDLARMSPFDCTIYRAKNARSAPLANLRILVLDTSPKLNDNRKPTIWRCISLKMVIFPCHVSFQGCNQK